MNEAELTVIGRDAHFKGELSLEHSARIWGSFEGRIVSKGEVHIAEGAQCRATVQARGILIDGNVEGDLVALERLELSSKAVVKGDITAAVLNLTQGASFVGRCSVGSGVAPAAANTAQIATPAASNGEIHSRPEPVRAAEIEPKVIKPRTPLSTPLQPAAVTVANAVARATPSWMQPSKPQA